MPVLRSFGQKLFVLLAMPAALYAQERLAVTGTFVTGYYESTARGEANQSQNFVPVGAKFDITGSILSPDFLDISAQPEINYGPQASEAGFQGGNGIVLRTTFLRKSISPVTFHYSNVQLEDVYFGSLTQLSSYSLKNRNKDLGVTWEFKPHGLPSVIVDWARNSVDSQPGIPNLPDYISSGNHVNADATWEHSGWNIDGFVHRQTEISNLLSQQDSTSVSGTLQQTVTQYQASARRTFLGDSELYMGAGNQSSANILLTLPVDLSTHYANANLRLFQRRRVKVGIRAAYTSNLASQLLAQEVSTLTAPGSAAPPTALLLPFSHGLSSLNFNGTANTTLGKGWSAFLGVERNSILSASDGGTLNADYFTTSGGLSYQHGYSWGSLSGEYGREFGLGSITGQSGTIQGQTWRVGAQRGKTGDLVVDVAVHGSDQNVANAQPFTNHSVSVEGSVSSRIVGRLSARLGGGWQWSDAFNSANDFRTNGYTARAGLDHPRFQINASLNNSISDSIPFYSQLLSGPGLAGALVGPLNIVPSDFRALTLNLHSNPIRKVELNASWTRSLQHLDGYLSNDFELMNFYLTYHFRRIQVETGFIYSNQVYSSYPDTVRQRYYIRFLRTARLL